MRTDVLHEGREAADATATKKVDNPLRLSTATALAATAIATAVIAAVATALATAIAATAFAATWPRPWPRPLHAAIGSDVA